MIMIQVLIILLIILLGFLVLRLNPLKPNVREITLSAMFIVITLICKRFFTILIPIFGVESFKIGIEYIPLMLAGFILPPSLAFFIGLSCDLLGLIVVSTGYPFFGFTLTMILVCLIPSIVAHLLKNVRENIIILITRLLLIVIGVAGIIYLFNMTSFKVSDVVVTLTTTYKVLLSTILVTIIAIVHIVISVISKKLGEEELKTFALWCLSVILVECVCTLILTPTWLQIMYGIPYLTSLCLRIVKEVFILPIELFIGYIILKTLQRVIK